MFQELYSAMTSSSAIFVYKVIYQSSFVWLPAFLLMGLWNLWITYRRAQYFAKQEYILLEIKVPKDIFKSPLAMEFFMNSLWTTLGEANWYQKYWDGSVRAWFSLEIASIEGQVRFFIWTRKGFKNAIEASFYSQYPGIEVYEVPDYTLPLSYDPNVNGLWGCEFKLTKSDAFPIKTYIDYGMDKDPKEEYKIDPMTPLIEAMGALGRGHQAWLQIILSAHNQKDKVKDKKTGKVDMVDKKWAESAKEEIEKILKKSKGDKGDDGKIIPGTTRFLTSGETDVIKALERSISKRGFDVGIRLIYTAPKDIFSMGNVGGLVGGMLHYNSNNLNGFQPINTPRGPKYKHWTLAWKDVSKKKIDFDKRSLLHAYKNRGYFYNEFKKPHFVLNTEELATIYHFPGGVSTTPAYSRINSKKSEAPSNLPI